MRRVTGGLLALAVGGSLVGCGGDGSSAPSSGGSTDAPRLVVSTGPGTHEGRVGGVGFPAAVHQLTVDPGKFVGYLLSSDSQQLVVDLCLDQMSNARILVARGAAVDETAAIQLLDDEEQSQVRLFNDGSSDRPDVGYCSTAGSVTEVFSEEVAGRYSYVVRLEADQQTPVDYELTVIETGYSCEAARKGEDPPDQLQSAARGGPGGDPLPASGFAETYCG